MRKTLFFLLLLLTSPARAFTIGTFNIEYFNSVGSHRYTEEDCAYLAEKIKESGASLLALQEVEGDKTMSYFINRFLPNWAFVGNDSQGAQDLYFLYDKRKVELIGGPVAFFANQSFYYEGKQRRLFSRPPLVAKFREKEHNFTFKVVNLHLKSGSTRGKKDKDAARRYNVEKRRAQTQQINRLANISRQTTFFMGDYNDPHPTGFVYPLLTLPPGSYSYDGRRSNLDYIGYQGLHFMNTPFLREVETSIPRRNSGRHEHPDHDMVLLDLQFGL